MKKIILASQSPRRQQLMTDAGFEFEVKTKDGIDEVFPEGLKKHAIKIAKEIPSGNEPKIRITIVNIPIPAP